MPDNKPAIGLVAVPGRRQRTVELAREIEDRGYSGIYCPSIGDGLALCQAIGAVTRTIRFGTGIAPIYYRQPADFAQTISLIHELSGGRFDFGIGVAHERSLTARGIVAGKPLGDTQEFVAALRGREDAGELPPIILATLRKKMISLASEIGDGILFANAARSHMQESLSALSAEQRDGDYFVGNMIPTCVHDSLEIARGVNRRTLSSYAGLPNYRNYWREAGYHVEMDAVEKCLADGRPKDVGQALSDAWVDDTTLAGPPSRIREELERWAEAGVKTPIIVPSSANGGQMKAFEELFGALG